MKRDDGRKRNRSIKGKEGLVVKEEDKRRLVEREREREREREIQRLRERERLGETKRERERETRRDKG